VNSERFGAAHSGAKVLATADSILAGKELQDQPRALLLVRLCQLSMAFSPGKAEAYWKCLIPLQAKVPKELQAALQDIRSVMEPLSTPDASGFLAELIVDIKEAKRYSESDIDAAKQRLFDCEARLQKRRWPFGKGPVHLALIQAWAGIDRKHALQLIDTISGNMQEILVPKLNSLNPLLPEEWNILAVKAGLEQTIEIAIKILDEKPVLHLPKGLLLKIAEHIRDSIPWVPEASSGEMTKALMRYIVLVKSQVCDDQAQMVPILLEELFAFVAKAWRLGSVWSERFTWLAIIMSTLQNLMLLTTETIEHLLKITPGHLHKFVQAYSAAMLAPPGGVEQAYRELLSKTGQDTDVEACFLVESVKRGLATEAMALATGSEHAKDLIPRLRRAWLCTHPESSVAAISAVDMLGDAVGEFLAQRSTYERIRYLREITDRRTRSIPGAMWAYPVTYKSHTPVERISEYLARNRLYGSYNRQTDQKKQFSEYVRMQCYGEYHCEHIDKPLLETLIAWRNDNATEVRAVLQAMWHAIKPDEEIMKLDWLRNNILTRCSKIFAAEPDVLIEDFLGWFKTELVDRGRSWRDGKTQFTLRYPDVALFGLCLTAATEVGNLSPKLRDEIVLKGLGRFNADATTVELAAQLYNSDKEKLDLAPPLQLKPDLVWAWQMGIIKNAIPVIVIAMAGEAGIAQTRKNGPQTRE